jgi:hypothetical protein
MAILSIFPDRETDLYTYYLEEIHHVFYPQLTFLALEAAICPKEDINKFQLCVHGKVLATKPEIDKIMKTKKAYKKLFKLSSCEIKPKNGIYDFRETWMADNLVTNKGYEGPQEFNQIEDKVTGKKIIYLGCLAEIPTLSFEVEVSAGCSFVNVERTDGKEFSNDVIFPFRLGFFLKWPKQIEKSETGTYSYPIHVFSYSPSEVHQLYGNNIIHKCLESDRCRLYFSLAPFIEKYIENSPSLPEDKLQELVNFKDEPTTDIWFVVYKEDQVTFPTEILEGQPELSVRNSKHGLYTDDNENHDLPYKEYHMQLKSDISAYSQKRHINPILHHKSSIVEQSFSWLISFFGFNLKSCWALVKSNMNTLAVTIAIAAAVVIPYTSPNTGIILTAVIVFLYVLICTGIVWFETRR